MCRSWVFSSHYEKRRPQAQAACKRTLSTMTPPRPAASAEAICTLLVTVVRGVKRRTTGWNSAAVRSDSRTVAPAPGTLATTECRGPPVSCAR
jgi:hypothetical protein